MAAPIVVALTGCTRGLGRALARYLADQGAIVAGCGRSEHEIARMRNEYGGEHDFAVVDVGADQSVKTWAKRVVDRFGAPHLLLNNAATIARNSPVWELAAHETDAVLRVNVAGTMNVLRHFVPAMIERSERESSMPGMIVNFSSGWGRSTSPDVAVYCASKWAIEGLTQSLAQDLANTRLRAFALNPGIIDTECCGNALVSQPEVIPRRNDGFDRRGPLFGGF
jgi:NAD(P)-dependent dehydrogenase (short-subunit alcohol dehydrogenase family)